MSGLCLEVGDTLQLQFLGDDGDTRHYVKVIGYLEDKSLLVTAPHTGGKLILVREGQPLAVRMMAGTELVGFTVSVLRNCTRPYPYLHLSYPQAMQSVTVRKSLRVKLDMDVTVRSCLLGSEEVDTDATPRQATIRDMSTTGAQLVADEPLAEVGNYLSVLTSLDVAEEVEEQNFTVIVRNVQVESGNVKGESRFLHGVEFQFSDRHESVLLHAYVYQQIAHSHR